MADSGARRMEGEIAVIGAGVAGLGAAWLLSRHHEVTLIEQSTRPGGHSNTVDVVVVGQRVAVDTGFIVYNERNYPNLVQLFEHLGVKTVPSEMSFSVSLDAGRLEYAGSDLAGLLAQPVNLLRPRFWRMLSDLRRFYRDAPGYRVEAAREGLSLEALLVRHGYGAAFIEDHLLPMAGAIWSASGQAMRRYPAAAFIDFFSNHGLLMLRNRPVWRTVSGGSREYVQRLLAATPARVQTGTPVQSVTRGEHGVTLTYADGRRERYAQVVFATHADQALRLLADPSPEESRLLGAFRYSDNLALLHEDPRLMPRRRAAWSSWNHLGEQGGRPAVTYWMNRLQPLPVSDPLFVTLNPPRELQPSRVHQEFRYAHPLFDLGALRAQMLLPSLQGQHRSWFCGSYFGYGFHEDALESGLWVAEAMSEARRPWSLPAGSGRTVLAGQQRRVAA